MTTSSPAFFLSNVLFSVGSDILGFFRHNHKLWHEHPAHKYSSRYARCRVFWQDRQTLAELTPAAAMGSRWRLFFNTYLVTALNPKGMVFFTAFLPQFIAPTGDTTKQLWLLALTFVTLATINATLYALFASSARRLLASRSAQRRFNLTGGSLLSVAGVWALFARQPT